MLAVVTENGERVIIDREVTVDDDYTDFAFPAAASANGYNVALVFPYSAGYTRFEGYVTYGDEARRLPFKPTYKDKVGYLFLKVPSKPGETAHLRFKDLSNMTGTLCRLMVVEYH